MLCFHFLRGGQSTMIPILESFLPFAVFEFLEHTILFYFVEQRKIVIL